MRKRFLISTGLLALVAALALTPNVFGRGLLGSLVAKNTASHGKSKVAVIPFKTVLKPGRLSLRVTARPSHKNVAWVYTARCLKDGRLFQYPLPGHVEDKVSRTPFTKPIRLGVQNPDTCDVQASAKLDYHDGKAVTVKIFDK